MRNVLIIFLIHLAVGWLAAGTPFRGDHIIYIQYAKRMHEGALLYRDIWDVTNPGIFWFYELAGTCFGFNEDGIHLFEWLYWLVFVLTVSQVIRKKYELPSLPLAPSILITGVYYLNSTSDPNHLTRAEGLVCFPLFLTAWLALLAIQKPQYCFRFAMLAGLAGGMVVLLKLAFGLCVATACLLPIIMAVRVKRTVKLLSGLATGFSAVVFIVTIYFTVRGGLYDLLDALFIAPKEILAIADSASYSRLFHSIRRMLEVYSPILASAVAGSLIVIQSKKDPLLISLIIVAIVGLPIILIQRWSWWDYHFMLMSIPASVIAAYTWPAIVIAIQDRICRKLNRFEIVVVAMFTVILCLPALGHGANSFIRLAAHRMGITQFDRMQARIDSGNAYSIAKRETEFLFETNALQGPIFIAGDPCFYWLAQRESNLKHNGWSIELFTPKLWQLLTEEIKVHKPVYLYVSDTSELPSRRLIQDRAPALQVWLEENYFELKRSANGVWYQIRNQKMD